MNESVSIAAREARLRREMARNGHVLKKSRLRSRPHCNNGGGYQVIDEWSNTIHSGENFDLWLEELEAEWLDMK